MTILDEAVAAAGIDPRELHAVLAVGQPDRTVELARAFEYAGQVARDSHRRSRHAHAAIGDSFSTDGVPVLDVHAHDTRSWRALGRAGQDLEDTAAALKRAVVALESAQATATAAINRMITELNRLAAGWSREVVAGPSPADREQLIARAASVVTAAATTIRRAIDDYDRGLLRDAADLAARGYLPPATTALSPAELSALGEFAGDAGAEFAGDIVDAAGSVWALVPIRAIWEPQAYTDDLVGYAGGLAESGEALIDDPAGTLLAAGQDLIGYEHWVNGEPGKAVGHIAAEIVLAGLAGRLLKGLRQAPDGAMPGRRPAPSRELDPAGRAALDSHLRELEQHHTEDFQRLWPDPDHNGHDRPASRDEARVALDLRERGTLPSDIERPPGRDQGDFYSPSTGQHYDLKSVHSGWPPLNNQRDKSMPFPDKYDPVNNGRFVDDIDDQISKGRIPIVDLRNADQTAIADIQKVIEARGWTDDVIWYP